MCNVGWPEAVMCCPSVAMLASVTQLLGDCGGDSTHCTKIRLLRLELRLWS